MLGRFKALGKRETNDNPRHIAITMHGIEDWAKSNKASLEEANQKSFFIIKNTIKSQIKLSIPILTFYLLPASMNEDTEQFVQLINTTVLFFNELPGLELIHQNKIKISVLGKWYDLPDRVIELIKKTIEATKDYDDFFVNFCINYNGQEEIVDACKLIARQVKAGKLDPDNISKDLIKENIYSSYFLPPELIIKNGLKMQSGLLLWDSVNSKTYFTGKDWPDFDRTVFMDAIKEFKKN